MYLSSVQQQTTGPKLSECLVLEGTECYLQILLSRLCSTDKDKVVSPFCRGEKRHSQSDIRKLM